MKLLLLINFALFYNFLYCQELSPEKLKISNSVSNYFQLERENIHLHIDKNIFLANEEIWFKGYVFDRKKASLNKNTTNVYVSILDKDGNKINQKLFFCIDGSFSGSFKLNKTFDTGDYFIQAYTNYMNNFTENESFISKIKIINENNPLLIDSNKINSSNINIDFNPEGGNLIENISNNVGVKISDCNGNPVMINDIEIQNSKNENVKFFKTNQFGFGKFNLTPSDETYKVVLTVNDKKTEAQLPAISKNGLSMEVNNIAFENKVILKLKTNALSLKSCQNQIFTIVIQQDEKVYFFDVNFDNGNLEQELIFSTDFLYDGMNTIRIIDNQNRELCQRMIYHFEKAKTITDFFVQSKLPNTINLAGTTNLISSNVSISVLPENSICSNNLTDIYASFSLNPYLIDNISNGKYYFNDRTQIKKNELDLLLLNQKTLKYSWYNLTSTIPKENFAYEKGIAIKGMINQKISKPENYKIKAYSISSQILKFSEINEKDEFFFENLIVPDSSKVNFSLVTVPDFKTVPLKYYAQIDRKSRNFTKAFKPNYSTCADNLEPKNYVKFDLPKLKKNEILLSEVEIKAKKNKLNNDKAPGNSRLRGYKITDFDANTDLLDYINLKGFEVNKRLGDISIKLRIRGFDLRKIREQEEDLLGLDLTQVFMNDFTIGSQNELAGIKMSEVDEIYVGNNNVEFRFGIIKIYLKKPKPRKVYTNSFLVSGGFEMINDFKNQDFENTFDNGFENFGVVNFNKVIEPNENGFFTFQIPNYNKRKLKLLIEGTSNDGKLLSETKIIEID